MSAQLKAKVMEKLALERRRMEEWFKSLPKPVYDPIDQGWVSNRDSFPELFSEDGYASNTSAASRMVIVTKGRPSFPPPPSVAAGGTARCLYDSETDESDGSLEPPSMPSPRMEKGKAICSPWSLRFSDCDEMEAGDDSSLYTSSTEATPASRRNPNSPRLNEERPEPETGQEGDGPSPMTLEDDSLFGYEAELRYWRRITMPVRYVLYMVLALVRLCNWLSHMVKMLGSRCSTGDEDGDESQRECEPVSVTACSKNQPPWVFQRGMEYESSLGSGPDDSEWDGREWEESVIQRASTLKLEIDASPPAAHTYYENHHFTFRGLRLLLAQSARVLELVRYYRQHQLTKHP
ncbi:hypothetical protein L249_0672 [Ophiocordyceps polyrhachis-furcata BCC 54312]|uniref:Uncharacterized protein n=1 Tax=Ophiocordyceps polyrhachis-furcata BCC 54312 TaxID=1330021 RepID=A0A367LC65_9HYPO|nr:hypothetical protein L249_0672 [Ophiocordyceps polyrhachis-furcata BCC 54312]